MSLVIATLGTQVLESMAAEIDRPRVSEPQKGPKSFRFTRSTTYS